MWRYRKHSSNYSNWVAKEISSVSLCRYNNIGHNRCSSGACMRQWVGSALHQRMACRLFGAKPLSELNAGLMSIEPLRKNFNEILIKIQNLRFTKTCLKISSAKWRPFCWGREKLMYSLISQVRHRNACPLLCLAKPTCRGFLFVNTPYTGVTICKLFHRE